MNNIVIKQLNEIIIKCVKELNNSEIEDDLYFELITNNNNEILNKYKSKIINLLETLFESKDIVINLEEINKLNLNDNTYNVIFEYIMANNLKYIDNMTAGKYNIISSYINDVNNYPMCSKEQQQQLLLKHSKYMLLIKKYEIKLLGQYYNVIDEMSKKEEFNFINSSRLKRYEIKLINELYRNKKLFDLTDDELHSYLYKKVRRYCIERKNSNFKYDNNIDTNEINIYNKRKLTNKEQEEILRKINYLENKRLFLKNDIANHNLKLVMSIARRYYKNNNIMSFEDIIQEGNIGLLNAIDKYDPSVGATFATYATWWIKQAITRALYDKDRTVRLPVHFIERLNKYKRFIEQYNLIYGYEPTQEEIMKELSFTIEEINEFDFHKAGVASLNAPVINSEDDEELALFIKDEKTNVEKTALNKKLNEDISNVLEEIEPYKQSIIYLRFGIIPKKPLVVTKNNKILVFTIEPINKEALPMFLKKHNFIHELELYKRGCFELENVLITGEIKTLEQVGQIYGLTRERIRQVENKTLKHLQNPKIKKQIDYLDS